MKTEHCGNLPDGRPVETYTLEAPGGATMKVLTFGGIITSLNVPDRAGQLADVVLGFDRLEDYVAGHPLFGALVGRVTGRIPNAEFHLDGRVYKLAKNNGPNHLHGGLCGFDKQIWTATPVVRADGADSLRLTYRSPAGEEGYPGTVDVAVTYTFTADHQLLMETEATADVTTPLSLAQHSYFHLGGEGTGDISDHHLTIFSDQIFGVDEILTPQAELHALEQNPADFRKSRRLGDAIPGLFQQHGDFYLLNESPGGNPIPAARVTHPASGRALSVSTNESCLQLYTSAMLEGINRGKSGVLYTPFSGLCLECHGHPAAVDHPELPSILIEPGKTMRRTTCYAFSTF